MKLYKHIYGRDVAILITHRFFVAGKGYKCKVRWFNIVNPRNQFDMGLPETIWIKNMKEWKEL